MYGLSREQIVGPEHSQEALPIFGPHVQVPSLEGSGFVPGMARVLVLSCPLG